MSLLPREMCFAVKLIQPNTLVRCLMQLYKPKGEDPVILQDKIFLHISATDLFKKKLNGFQENAALPKEGCESHIRRKSYSP